MQRKILTVNSASIFPSSWGGDFRAVKSASFTDKVFKVSIYLSTSRLSLRSRCDPTVEINTERAIAYRLMCETSSCVNTGRGRGGGGGGGVGTLTLPERERLRVRDLELDLFSISG